MKSIDIRFTGRLCGALGVLSTQTLNFHVDDWKEAVRQMYASFEHITVHAIIEDSIPCLPLPDLTKAWDTCQHKRVVHTTPDGSGPGKCADCGFLFTQQFDAHGRAQA